MVGVVKKGYFVVKKTDSDIPILEPYEVYRKIKRAKKPNSVIPGDILKYVTQLFSPELAEPVSIIYKRFSLSFQYPRQWVKVSQIAVPKVFHPKSEDDLRPLLEHSSSTRSMIAGWLLPGILPYMDPGQNGMKGSSIVHYLIRLLHFFLLI